MIFKMMKNGVFPFGISLFVLGTLMSLYYANEESDNVINCATKSVKYWIKNISGNIRAVFFKLWTRNVHYKRNKISAVVLLSWQQFCRWFCFFCDVFSWCHTWKTLLQILQIHVKEFSLSLQSPKLFNPLSSEFQNASSVDVFGAKLKWSFLV